MGNTYNKILAKSSVDNLRTFHRAQKTHRKDVEKEITEISGVVNDRLKILSDHYKNIDNTKFEEFAEVSKQCSKEDLVVDVKNFNLFLQKNSLTSDDLSLDNFIDNLNQISDYEFVVDQFKEIYKSQKLSDFNNYLQNLKLINEHGEVGIKLFYEYGNVNEETISFLRKKVDEYRKLTDGIFGGFLKGNQIIKIENEIEKLKSKKKIDLKKNDPNLLFFCNYADEFFSFCEKKKVNYKVLLQIIKKIILQVFLIKSNLLINTHVHLK